MVILAKAKEIEKRLKIKELGRMAEKRKDRRKKRRGKWREE